jgi:selenocysteine lyase/cysteine desulfurase
LVVRVKLWHVNAESFQLRLGDLESLMGPRTKLVAVTPTSNILGTINPIREIADAVHAHGALLCVDGVAYAPHRAIDVQAMDVDFYAFSFYKTYRPHHALLYGRRDLLVDLPNRSFDFIAEDDVPYKFQPGNVNYELSYGMLGLMDYFDELAGAGPNAHQRDAVESSFTMIAEHEQGLSARLLDFLCDRPGVRIIGEQTADDAVRVPIISFVVEHMPSSEVVARMDEHRVAIRFGHFYSARLIEHLGLTSNEGVVRVSMVHYNTLEEVEQLTAALDEVLPGRR